MIQVTFALSHVLVANFVRRECDRGVMPRAFSDIHREIKRAMVNVYVVAIDQVMHLANLDHSRIGCAVVWVKVTFRLFNECTTHVLTSVSLIHVHNIQTTYTLLCVTATMVVKKYIIIHLRK